MFHADSEIKVIGIRHGEKMYETLLTNEECCNAIEMGNFYRVPCDKRELNYTPGVFRTSVFQFRPYHGTQLYEEIMQGTGLHHGAIQNSSLGRFEGRQQFNFNFGNYSAEPTEVLNEYIINLVKCVPLNEQRKLRYPSKKEMDCCFENLQKEISTLSPKIVFLLGEKVTSSVEKHLGIKFEEWDEFNYQSREHKGTYYVPVHHLSYIYVYKRKMIEQYTQSIRKMVMSLL